MNQDNECPICYEPFDKKERIPMLVCVNQHNVCQLCVFNVKEKCPLCKCSFNSKNIFPNRTFM